MVTINATQARNNIGKLWSQAADGPVTVLSAGQAVTVVRSPAEFAKHLFPATDMNALLNISIDDVFEEYR